METTKKKWTQRMFTSEFKLEVLSYYTEIRFKYYVRIYSFRQQY